MVSMQQTMHSNNKLSEIVDRRGNKILYTRNGEFDYENNKLIIKYNITWAKSLSGIGEDFMQDATCIDFVTYRISSHALGLLKLKRLDADLPITLSFVNAKIHITSLEMDSDVYEAEILQYDRWNQAALIINRYLKNAHQCHDMISCQEELMDNGLGEYAKL